MFLFLYCILYYLFFNVITIIRDIFYVSTFVVNNANNNTKGKIIQLMRIKFEKVSKVSKRGSSRIPLILSET